MACVAIIVEEALDTREDVSSWPFVCHFLLTKVFSSGCMVVSAYNMTYLCLERYLAIVNPMQYDPEKVVKVGRELQTHCSGILWGHHYCIKHCTILFLFECRNINYNELTILHDR